MRSICRAFLSQNVIYTLTSHNVSKLIRGRGREIVEESEERGRDKMNNRQKAQRARKERVGWGGGEAAYLLHRPRIADLTAVMQILSLCLTLLDTHTVTVLPDLKPVTTKFIQLLTQTPHTNFRTQSRQGN